MSTPSYGTNAEITMIMMEPFAHSCFPRSRESGKCHTGWQGSGAGAPDRAVQRGTALPTTPNSVARAREILDISALPNDALDEINRLQTRKGSRKWWTQMSQI